MSVTRKELPMLRRLENCAANEVEPMYRDIHGVEFCCRCGFTRAAHERVRGEAKKLGGAA